MLRTIARLALSLWIGSVACVAFLVAPRVFSFLHDNPRAGDLMAPVFKWVDLAGIVAALLFLVAARKHRLRAILAGLLGAAAAVNAFGITPRILERGPHLQLFHKISEGLWAGILIGGVILLLLGPGSRRKVS